MMTKQQALDVVDLLARTPGVMADHAQEALVLAADALRREVASAAAEPRNGDMRVYELLGTGHSYGVEYFHYGQWCPVMSPADVESPLLFTSQQQAQEFIAEKSDLPF